MVMYWNEFFQGMVLSTRQTSYPLQTYIQQMDSILTYMDNLSKVDTENVKPTTYALPMQNVFREDVVKPSLPREAALANAPLQEDGYFKVPKVLED